MKRNIIFLALCALGVSAHAQSSVSITGTARVAVARGNDGTTPVDANTTAGKAWALHDESSSLSFRGREELGNGMYAGFNLTTFTNYDDGSVGGGGIMWSANSTVKLGGKFGEVYFGRSLTPAALTVLFADPYYWDGSAVQVGWQIQQANYLSTAFLRTNNTVGYTSPSLGGLTVMLAASPGEGVTGRDLGASANYKSGALWIGGAYDEHDVIGGQKEHMATVAGSYDFKVLKPLFSVTSSKVGGRTYKAYSVGTTVPVGPSGLIKAFYANLNDFNTATVAEEQLRRVTVGYQHSLSKRTNLFADVSQAKAETRTAKNFVQFGMEHSF